LALALGVVWMEPPIANAQANARTARVGYPTAGPAPATGRFADGERMFFEIPVAQPTRYLYLINLKTAKALGLAIPQSELLRADEVIQ
jgi:hypothetical protein